MKQVSVRSEPGGTAILAAEQWLPRGLAVVFDFYADPLNLERITPAFLNFHVLRSTTPRIEAGTEIDYELRLHGIPIRWRSRIEGWEPGRRFVDTQVRGPYALWHHLHEFEARAGGTAIRDVVRYRLPFGRLGALAAGRFVERDLRAIFAYRHDAIAAIFAV